MGTPRERLRRAVSALVLVLGVAVNAAGCGLPGRLLLGNMGVLLRTPTAVPDKVTAPYRPDARLAVLWVGHATALVQIEDKFILTDPVFTSTVGVLVKRLVEPGIEPAHLPPLDAVLVSHMHFDHLSLGSLELIEDRARALLVPLGGAVYVPTFTFPVRELSPWRHFEHDGLRVTAVPVRHAGFRFGADHAWMTESYTGYVIQYRGVTVYFGGDTAYDARSFAETRRRFPSIDLALLPIGPIHPREHMAPKHVDPAEAVQAFADLGARRMIPIHYGTFINGEDAPGEPERMLRSVMAERRLGEDTVQILRIGEQRVLLRR